MRFFVELYEVTAGAAINNSARFAQIKFLQSDEPQSLIYFSVGSRLPVAHKKATLISLQVSRDSGTGAMMSVNFSTQVTMGYVLTYIKVFFFIAFVMKWRIIDTLFSYDAIIIHIVYNVKLYP